MDAAWERGMTAFQGTDVARCLKCGWMWLTEDSRCDRCKRPMTIVTVVGDLFRVGRGKSLAVEPLTGVRE